MNEHQRKMARKAKKPAGYAGGGLIGAASSGIERMGRIFGTENARRIAEAERSLEPEKVRGHRRRTQIDEAVEERNYRHGGKIKGY